MQFTRLVANDVKALVSGSGSIFVTATTSLDASVSGSGAILYAGNPQDVTQNVTGSGAITGANEKNEGGTMLPVLAARAAAVVMVGIAAFQVALVVGAPWGAYTQGGETEGPLDTSGRVLAAVSCAILLVMTAAILARAHEGPLKNARGAS